MYKSDHVCMCMLVVMPRNVSEMSPRGGSAREKKLLAKLYN